jgi:hypothetical protein
MIKSRWNKLLFKSFIILYYFDKYNNDSNASDSPEYNNNSLFDYDDNRSIDNNNATDKETYNNSSLDCHKCNAERNHAA